MSFLSLEVSLLNEIQQRRSKKACFLLWSFPQKRLTSKCRQSWAHPAKELSVSLLRAFKSLSGILLWRFIPFLVSNLIIAFLLNCLWAVWPLKSGSLLARLGMVIPQLVPHHCQGCGGDHHEHKQAGQWWWGVSIILCAPTSFREPQNNPAFYTRKAAMIRFEGTEA